MSKDTIIVCSTESSVFSKKAKLRDIGTPYMNLEIPKLAITILLEIDGVLEAARE